MTYSKGIIVQEFHKPTHNKTLFLDRDGILLHTVKRADGCKGSARSWDEVRLTPAGMILNLPEVTNDWNLIMVSNQPDIARGFIDEKFVRQVNELVAANIPLNVALVCPHGDDDECNCRKPKTGLIDEFRQRYGIRGKEFMIGDTWRDKYCADVADIPFILLEGL